jgi:hypothetical protein
MSCPGGAYQWAPEIPTNIKLASTKLSKCELVHNWAHSSSCPPFWLGRGGFDRSRAFLPSPIGINQMRQKNPGAHQTNNCRCNVNHENSPTPTPCDVGAARSKSEPGVSKISCVQERGERARGWQTQRRCRFPSSGEAPGDLCGEESFANVSEVAGNSRIKIA